jgi:hypothetical protein
LRPVVGLSRIARSTFINDPPTDTVNSGKGYAWFRPLWYSGFVWVPDSRHPGAWLVVQNDGNVVIYKAGAPKSGSDIWASKTVMPHRDRDLIVPDVLTVEIANGVISPVITREIVNETGERMRSSRTRARRLCISGLVANLNGGYTTPQATFDGKDLYPTVFDKAAALLESLVRNHPFVDGNKRVGITATALFCNAAAINSQRLKPNWYSSPFT